MVLQADGGELAVATICASMALADAGIELYDLVTACSVGYCGTQVRLKRVMHTRPATAYTSCKRELDNAVPLGCLPK